MSCRSGEVGRLENLRRPGRIVSGFVGLSLLLGSFWLSGAQHGTEIALLGILMLFVALLLPALTDFEVDLFGIRTKASLRGRESVLRSICEHESRKLASLAALIGVESEQISNLAEEAIEDSCRLWRGRIVDQLVREFLVCRAVHLVNVSLRLGGPYRVLTPSGTATIGPRISTFATFAPTERLILALVEYCEVCAESVAGMLELDRSVVEETLRQGRAAIEQAVGQHGP